MIRLVDLRDPAAQFLLAYRPLPQLAKAREPPRDETEAAAGPAPRSEPARYRRAAGDHVPIYIIRRAIEIDQRPRRVRDQQRGPGFPCHGFCDEVDKAIFEPDARRRMIAHPRFQLLWIGAAAVRNGEQNGRSE